MSAVNSECVNYNYNITDLIVPPMSILQVLCVSYDKTRMFIMSVLRLIIFIILFYISYSIGLAKWDSDNIILKSLFCAFVVVILFNIFFIVLLVRKKTMIVKNNDAENVALFLNKEKDKDYVDLS